MGRHRLNPADFRAKLEWTPRSSVRDLVIAVDYLGILVLGRLRTAKDVYVPGDDLSAVAVVPDVSINFVQWIGADGHLHGPGMLRRCPHVPACLVFPPIALGMVELLLEEFASCTSLAEVQALFADLIAAHGYTASACGAFIPADKGPVPHFFFQNWPAGWISLYQQRDFHLVDFSVAEARRRIAPFTWADVQGQRVMSRAEEELWHTANQWGWTDGLSVPIHGPGGYLGLVTMAGGRPLVGAERDRLHLLALHVHERCRAIAGLTLVNAPEAALTARELECLRWVAAGKTDPEIAPLVGLSRETVKNHVDGARRKLGAQTRPQAVARLVLAGLN